MNNIEIKINMPDFKINMPDFEALVLSKLQNSFLGSLSKLRGSLSAILVVDPYCKKMEYTIGSLIDPYKKINEALSAISEKTCKGIENFREISRKMAEYHIETQIIVRDVVKVLLKGVLKEEKRFFEIIDEIESVAFTIKDIEETSARTNDEDLFDKGIEMEIHKKKLIDEIDRIMKEDWGHRRLGA